MTLAASAFVALADAGAAAQAAGPTVLKSLPHHAVFLLLLQISVLLFTARLLGELMRKLGQPAVIGELMAGVLLGPSVLGAFLPEVQAFVFPKSQHQSDLLSAISWLGVLFLLIVTGLETDIALIKRRGKSALIISAGGILVPFASGIALGWLLPEAYLAAPEGRLVFALFMAVAMSISAVPVIAKVLMDLKLMRRDVGPVAGVKDFLDGHGHIARCVASSTGSPPTHWHHRVRCCAWRSVCPMRWSRSAARRRGRWAMSPVPSSLARN